ncbi:MAG TPA: hypothetical protein VKA51_03180, partial [Rubrobacteraceae bacterium]|nr:hypothetical protein [Rubrobacteraceae bacterium]
RMATAPFEGPPGWRSGRKTPLGTNRGCARLRKHGKVVFRVTTLIYADYSPGQAPGAAYAEAAFGAGTNSGTNLSATEDNSEQLPVPEDA